MVPRQILQSRASGHAHLHSITILHHDKFLAPRQIVPRHCASAPNKNPARWQFTSSDQPCTATRVMLNKICTRTAKSAPYPPCTVTVFWPRYRGVPGPCPDAASGNTTSPYCRVVIVHLNQLTYNKTTKDCVKLYLNIWNIIMYKKAYKQEISTQSIFNSILIKTIIQWKRLLFLVLSVHMYFHQ